MNQPTPFPLPDRFWAKTRRNPDGCLIWTAALNSKGYGIFSLGGKLFLAHRLSHLAEVGPIPERYEVDHLCMVRDCIEPLHLEAVTSKENNRRRLLAMGVTPKERRPRTNRPRRIRPPAPTEPFRYRFVTHNYVHPVQGQTQATHVDLPYMRRRCDRCEAA